MSWQQDWIDRDIPEEVWPTVNESSSWKVVKLVRLSARDNRPGEKKIRVHVYDRAGVLMPGIKISMDVEASDAGVAYDHLNIWQLTGWRRGREGYWEWEHLGVPTRYVLWIEDEELPLIENIRTDLNYEYFRPSGTTTGGWRPVNKPGVFSYSIEIHQKGEPVS